jgi:nickel-dependent lactate racemase
MQTSMNVRLAFGKEGLVVDLPDGFHYQVLECPVVAALPDPGAAIEAALDHPVKGPSFRELASGKRTAAISVCDITRPAPNRMVLPPLLTRLEAAGIPKSGIRILIATGLHRPATEAEIRQIVGDAVAEQCEILNHDARNPNLHTHLGTTRSGTPVYIDKRFIEADLHLTLGLIEPHLMLGFSGGRKLIAPGLAFETTIKNLHSSRFMRDARTCEGSIDDNPLHAELLEIARMARHDFLIDAALTRTRGLAGVWAGEPEAAHRCGVEQVRKAMYQPVSEPVDAVITTGAGYPLDLTFYQSIKGITAASQIVKKGGRILLFGACEEGVGAPEFRRMAGQYTSDVEFLKAIDGAPVTIDQWQLEKLALATQKAEVVYCTPGLPEAQIKKLWGKGFKRAEDAIHAFFSGLNPASQIAVMPEGPYVLTGVRGA